MFCNLYEFMEEDPAFHREDYFENIFTAMEWEGKLHVLPTLAMPSYVYMNKTVTDALNIDINRYDSITPMEILEIYGQALDEGIVGDDFWLNYRDGGRCVLWSLEMNNHVDTAAGKARFDSPEMLAYLQASQRIQTESTVYNALTTGSEGLKALLAAENNALMAVFSFRLEFYRDIIAEGEKVSKGLPLVNNKREALWTPLNILSIPQSSSNKALAWEFVKYCIAESETVEYIAQSSSRGGWLGDRFFSFLPINRNNLRKYVTSYFGEAAPEVIEAAEALIAKPRAKFNALSDLDMRDIFTKYYDSQFITAEECAKLMQGRADIYFGE